MATGGDPGDTVGLVTKGGRAIPRDDTHDSDRQELDDLGLIFDLDDDELLADWARVDREAARALRTALGDRRHQSPPASVATAGAALRGAVESGVDAVDWLVAGAGLDRRLELAPDVPLQPEDVLWSLVAASITPEELTGLDPEDEATLHVVEPPDWVAPLVAVVRQGPGVRADPELLARHLAEDPDVELSPDDFELIEASFEYRMPAWQAAGVLDADRRLTEAGAWILPRAACSAWGSDFDHPDAEADAALFGEEEWDADGRASALSDGHIGSLPDASAGSSRTGQRDSLVDAWTARFETWLRATAIAADVAWVEGLLELRVAYLDEEVARWDRDDLATLVLEVAPARLSEPAEAIREALPALATFLRYLDAEDLLHPDSDPIDELTAWLDHAGPAAVAAMDDRSRWGPSKALFTAMQVDGVEITNRAAVQDWIDAFNARPNHERDEVLGGFGPAAGLPPLVLPPEDDLANAACATALWRQVMGLVAAVGDRLAVTDSGNLKLADARRLVDELDTGDVFDPTWWGRTRRTRSSAELPALHRVLELSLDVGLLERQGRSLRPVPDVIATAEQQPTTLWEDLVLAWMRAGILGSHYRHWGPPRWAHELDGGVIALLAALVDVTEPIELDRMAAMLHADLGLDDDPGTIDWVRDDVHRFARNLAVAGVVEVTGVRVRREPSGEEHQQRGRVTLTDLGRLLLTRAAAARAHRIGSLGHLEAGQLLDTVGELPIDVAEAEVAAWLAHREPGKAAADTAAAVAGGNRERAMLAFLVFDAVGPAAEPAVARLTADPVAGPFARAWLVQHGLAPIEAPGGDDIDAILGILSTVAERDGPDGLIEVFSQLGDAHEQLEFLDAAWRSGADEAAEVLDVVGSLHADKAVRKAARKAAFKRRSAT